MCVHVHCVYVCVCPPTTPESAFSPSTSCWLPPIGEYHLSAAPIYSQVTQHRERTKHGARETGTAAVAGSSAPGLNSAPPLRPFRTAPDPTSSQRSETILYRLPGSYSLNIADCVFLLSPPLSGPPCFNCRPWWTRGAGETTNVDSLNTHTGMHAHKGN